MIITSAITRHCVYNAKLSSVVICQQYEWVDQIHISVRGKIKKRINQLPMNLFEM